MWLTFLCPGDVIYDVRRHNYILKFAEVEDIIMDILIRVKLKIESFDDFGAMVQFVKPLTISLVESQMGINAVQQCSIENQKGAITMDFVLW